MRLQPQEGGHYSDMYSWDSMEDCWDVDWTEEWWDAGELSRPDVIRGRYRSSMLGMTNTFCWAAMIKRIKESVIHAHLILSERACTVKCGLTDCWTDSPGTHTAVFSRSTRWHGSRWPPSPRAWDAREGLTWEAPGNCTWDRAFVSKTCK